MNDKFIKVGVLTFPISEAGVTPLTNLTYVLCSIVKEVHIITGNAGSLSFENNKQIQIYRVEHAVVNHNVFFRIINYIKTQLLIANKLIKLGSRVDYWVFFIGGEGLILPMFAAKLLRKKIIIASASARFKDERVQNGNEDYFLRLLRNCTYYLACGIILYSNGLVEKQGLKKYAHKIFIAHEHFLDFNKFKNINQFKSRENLIGYIGRFSNEKGVINFIRAIPEVLKVMCEVRFLICGDGPLRGEIESELRKQNLQNEVELDGWISHDHLPQYLNKLKLIVLPSYYEGLPNIMVEAMACGTPILATPVGAIPDFIRDGEIGFILENNSPECISQNIIRALNHPDLEQIGDKGMTFAEKEFCFEKAVDSYREVLNTL
jgi:glycosyltransferase involved in cell wall biosynthesis